MEGRDKIMKRILAATDGSEGSERAVRYAADLATDFGADLIIANVIGGYEFPSEAFEQISQSQNAWFKELLAGDSAQILDKARDSILALGVPKIELESRSGDPVQMIMDIADDERVDAIVVGKRGLGRVQGLLLGSVSQKIVSLAKKVVMVVP